MSEISKKIKQEGSVDSVEGLPVNKYDPEVYFFRKNDILPCSLSNVLSQIVENHETAIEHAIQNEATYEQVLELVKHDLDRVSAMINKQLKKTKE